MMIRDLAPLVGRRLSFAVVPDWHGKWPVAAHPDYCQLVRENSAELLLHGYFHHRQRGWGPTTVLTRSADEMNGLDAEETGRTLDRGQRIFTQAFGKRARGFLAPAWQAGHVRGGNVKMRGPDYVLGFFSLESARGRRIALSTWSWDCGRAAWLGHVGDGIGWLSHSFHRGVPTLAVHPRDLQRGFWKKILRLTHDLLKCGYEPSTPAELFETE
jgi:peptidoglycan/xylan/chitin deacetylase (PgdA/CDA1 family)